MIVKNGYVISSSNINIRTYIVIDTELGTTTSIEVKLRDSKDADLLDYLEGLPRATEEDFAAILNRTNPVQRS